ncbi:MAG: putative toxin-antitoxin system toxin component, PIN family [Fulvivirga sp.]
MTLIYGISFLITKNHSRLDRHIFKGKLTLVFSEELLQEFIDVAERPKLKKYFRSKDISELIDLFDEYGDLVKVKTKVKKCRDPKDNFLLSLAIDGKVDFLVTGDKDLLVLDKINGTKIITLSDLTNLLK